MAGCSSCSTTTKDGKVAGCRSNGGCKTGGCNKMNVFDWLSNMDMPSIDTFDVAEIRFKGGRKEFYRNTNKLTLTTGDAVVVEVQGGHHVGFVSLQGELVRLQMQKKKVQNNEEIKQIYRLATQKDLEKFYETEKRELPTLFRTRQIIQEQKLGMKLSDVEYQADNTKATFFYSAEDRVDFRELIKVLAGEFKIRVEMRQISLRQEAGRLGGIGSCGRELCCSTWLSDFKSVSTTAARYQNLSLNPSKLSGQCGRLKCCLNYELDTYMDALKDIPEVESSLQTQQGDAKLQKTDIFRKIMWFGYETENTWFPISTERVREIQLLNKKGVKPLTLTEDKLEIEEGPILPINNDLELMDRKFRNKTNKKKKKKKPRNPNAPQANVAEGGAVVPAPNPNRPRRENIAPNAPKEGGEAREERTSGGQTPRNEGNRNKNRNRNRNRRPGDRGDRRNNNDQNPSGNESNNS